MRDSDEVTVPTSCTLDTRQAMERVARWHALSEETQTTVSRLEPEAVQIHYTWTPEVDAELTSLVTLEAECCAFLRFAVHRTDQEAVLIIEPAAGAAADVGQSMDTLTSVITGRLP